MNPVLKRYLISSLITFVSTFLIVFSTEFSVETMTGGAILGIAVVAGRAAIKALVEFWNSTPLK